MSGDGLPLRAPRDDDWEAILELANRSVAGVRGAGTQEDWLENRRHFTGSARRHFVATRDEQVVGYAAIESGAAAGSWRLFLVTAAEDLPEVGERLLEEALRQLREVGAREAWMVEYADDGTLVPFVLARGFAEQRRMELFGGAPAVVLARSLEAPPSPPRA